MWWPKEDVIRARRGGCRISFFVSTPRRTEIFHSVHDQDDTLSMYGNCAAGLPPACPDPFRHTIVSRGTSA
jgi:hypothetical protein